MEYPSQSEPLRLWAAPDIHDTRSGQRGRYGTKVLRAQSAYVKMWGLLCEMANSHKTSTSGMFSS